MKCLNIMKAHYGDNNFNLGITYYNISLLLEKMDNFPESLEMCQKAYKIFSNHYGENHQYSEKAKNQCNKLKEMLE